MASTSGVPNIQFPVTESASNYCLYPAPLAKFDDVAADRRLFLHSLEKLHKYMNSKFFIPVMGGRELDLHRLFLEVTSRGGIEKIIRERRWKEITAVFKFPSTATNASFVLRKYYSSLLYHYEQMYYFKTPGWIPTTDDSRSPSKVPVPAPRKQQFLHPLVNASELPEATSACSVGTPVIGVIDGKFESGYLVTVTVGSEKLKGVLYQAPQNPALPTMLQHGSVPVSYLNTSPAALGVHRHRRKKSEIKKRDPAHPKPNRSGYNFFFAEQHAKLKPHHHGKDREISKIIGELWNKLIEPEKAVYQEQALKDKERYQAEMEGYREKMKTGQGVGDAVPLQQQIPGKDMMDTDLKVDETEGVVFPQTADESSSGESEYEDDKGAEHDLGMDASAGMIGVGAESSYLGAEKLSKGGEMELQNKEGNDDGDRAQKMGESSSMMAMQ
ncbi:high mobility group B protein 15 isoform X1 [Prosopis cineraria]|uniref:high mobility group B protein 15 isoform X1 n=1 Tax=Prosopis cineraria TaxID=364024 RepID=UPI0024100A1E|nr:high mobility group B protein 15 isoform X1 [Prosopis cineraria]XP_054805654.1 high mobility group B protein 15 isoform X1 [Prosopis cineraria]XP_054805655.1 high mobility group B protein 15 isoform X1 [Prosopis cineraria]XP_054805656.1 high mobility group B protein 15 isoform X1 [Prosopis cineraria]XP_054805657.1 high mobility group B protein 15 isoform X1 [Prosopis cineraria]